MSAKQFRLFDRTDDGTVTGFPDQTAATPVSGPIITPQRLRDEVGSVQVEISGGVVVAKVNIEGRMHSSMPWSVLESVDETDVDASTSTVRPVRILPEMQVTMVNGTATAVTVWLQE